MEYIFFHFKMYSLKAQFSEYYLTISLFITIFSKLVKIINVFRLASSDIYFVLVRIHNYFKGILMNTINQVLPNYTLLEYFGKWI